MEKENIEKIKKAALSMRALSYAPYSGFAVGAALLCADGTVFAGCNVENASYSCCICAERTALFKAVSEGRRDFAAIAVAGGKAGEAAADFCSPCGACRQCLAEFCGPDFPVVMVREGGEEKVRTLGELLGDAFKL